MHAIRAFGVRSSCRAIVLVASVTACAGGPGFRPQPLPELVPVVSSRDLARIHVKQLLLSPGEAFIWDIQWKGLTVARAEMFVDETEVRSRLATSAFASSFAQLRHELTTLIDRDRAEPTGGEETLVESDDTKGANIESGKLGHTPHTALGVLRAWAHADAKPGFLLVQHLGNSYRLDVQQPIVEELQGTETLKIVGRLRMREPVTIAIWLTNDAGRVPQRIEISQDDAKITAALVQE